METLPRQQHQLQQQQVTQHCVQQQQHQQHQQQRATTPYSWCRKRMLHSSTAHLAPHQPQPQPQAAYYPGPGLTEDKYEGECYRYDYPFDYCPPSSSSTSSYYARAPACANERGDDAASFANGAAPPRMVQRRLMTPLLPDEELKTVLQSFLSDRGGGLQEQSPSAQSVDSGCFEDYASSASSSCGAFTPLAQWPSPPPASDATIPHGSPYGHDSHQHQHPHPSDFPAHHPHHGDASSFFPMCEGHVPHVDLPLAGADSLRPSASSEDLYSIVDQVFSSISKQFEEEDERTARAMLIAQDVRINPEVDHRDGGRWQEAAANRGNDDFDGCGRAMLCDNCGAMAAGEACERCGRLLVEEEQPQQPQATTAQRSRSAENCNAQPSPKERLVAVTRPLLQAAVAPTTAVKPRTVGVVEPRVVVKIPRALLRDAPPLLPSTEKEETCSIKSIPSSRDEDDDAVALERRTSDKDKGRCGGGQRKKRRASREEYEEDEEAVRVTETLPEHFRAALLRRATALLDWAGVAAVEAQTASQKKEKRRRRRQEQQLQALASNHRKGSPKRRRVDESDRGRARKSQTDERHERRGACDDVLPPRTRISPLKLIRRFAPETNQSEYYAVDCSEPRTVPVVDLDSGDENSDALRGATDRVTSYLRQRMPLLNVSVVKTETPEETSRPCSVVLSRLTDDQIGEFTGSSSSSSSRSDSPMPFAAYKDMKGFADLVAANGVCVPANGHAGRPHGKGRGRRKRCRLEDKISEKRPSSSTERRSDEENGFLIQRDKAKKGENENSVPNIGSRTNPSIQSHRHMLEHAANNEYANDLSEALQKRLRLAIAHEVNTDRAESESSDHGDDLDYGDAANLPDLDLNPEDLCESSRSDTRNEDFALITPGPDVVKMSPAESDSFATSESTPTDNHHEEDSMSLSMPILFSEDDADLSDLAHILTDVPLDTLNHDDTPSAEEAASSKERATAGDANSVESRSSNTAREQTLAAGDDEEIVCLTPSTPHQQPSTNNKPEKLRCGKARFRCGDSSKDSAKWLVCATAGCRFGTRFPDRWRRHALCHVAGTNALRCIDCLRRFHSLEALLRHEKKDHGGKKYECKICEIETSDLKKHMLIHKPSKDLTCSFCGVSFRYKNSLKRHTFTQHREERSIVCQLCEAPVPNVAKLREHITRKHPNAPASVWKMEPGHHPQHVQPLPGFRPIAPKGPPPTPAILQSAPGAATLSLATGPNGMLYLISNPAPAQPSYFVNNNGQLQLIQPQPQPQPYFISSQPTQFFSAGAHQQPLLLPMLPSNSDLTCATPPTPAPSSLSSVLSPRDLAMLSVPTPEVPTPEPSSDPLLDLPDVMREENLRDAFSLVSVEGASTESVSVRANDGTELARMDILERAILEIPDFEELSALNSVEEGKQATPSNEADSISAQEQEQNDEPRGDFVCARCGHRTQFVHFHKVHVKNCLSRAAKQEKGGKMRPA